MPYRSISGTVPQYSISASGTSADGYWLKFYAAGTTTPINMGTDTTPTATLAKCTLNTRGEPISNSADPATVFIPHIDQNYKIVLYANEADADANTTASAVWAVDNLTNNFLTPTDIDSYANLRLINTASFTDGMSINITDDGIAGNFILRNSTAHGLADNGGTIIVIDADWYAERIYEGPVYAAWWGVTFDGTTDDSAAWQSISDAGFTNIIGSAGTTVIENSVTFTSASASTFNQGLQLSCAGIGETIFLNRVDSAPMLDIDAGGVAGTNFLMGCKLSGFKIIKDGTRTAQVGIRISTAYQVEFNQIHIDGLTGNGMEIPTVVGDNDASNMVKMRQVRIENCSTWGIKADGDSGFNELSFLDMEHCFIQACGTSNVAYQPPSGGMSWKGQICRIVNSAFTLNQNCALWIPGQSGLAQNMYLEAVTFENNVGRNIFCRGVSLFKAKNIQQYHNDSFVGTDGIEFEGGSFTVRNIEIDGCVVRATSGNNAFTAFKISGANTEFDSCRVKNVVWDNFDYVGQTRFDGWLFDDIPTDNYILEASSGTALTLKRKTVAGRGGKIPLRLRGGAGGTPSTSGEWIAASIAERSIDNSGLAITTRYYCYLYDNSGLPALELSTTVAVIDADTGYMIKTGDATRFYVGSAITDGSSNFLTSGAGWLNPDIKYIGSQSGVTVYYWHDSTNDLRFTYAAAPTSDTDGTVIGTQT